MMWLCTVMSSICALRQRQQGTPPHDERGAAALVTNGIAVAEEIVRGAVAISEVDRRVLFWVGRFQKFEAR